MCLAGQAPAAPATAAQAVAMVQAGLGWLATTDAAALQAETLRGLERATSMHTPARCRVLAAFCAQAGYQHDGPDELRSFGSEAEFMNADVRKEDDVRALADRAVAQFGRLDIAVNNAGTEGQAGPITDQTAERYAATFDTNVLGVILSMKHEVRVMREQGSGSIVNISSTYGHEGAAGASVYVASKHAVEGITKSVALETAKLGIRVNAVAPGPIETSMLTRCRPLTPHGHPLPEIVDGTAPRS